MGNLRQPPIQGLIMIAIAEFDSSSGSNIKTVNNRYCSVTVYKELYTYTRTGSLVSWPF